MIIFDFAMNGIVRREISFKTPWKELSQQLGAVLRLRRGDVNRHTSATDRVNTDGSPLPKKYQYSTTNRCRLFFAFNNTRKQLKTNIVTV